MLKFFLGFLLVANIGLFAYNTGIMGSDGSTGRESGRLKSQLNTERMRIEPSQAALPVSKAARGGASAVPTATIATTATNAPSTATGPAQVSAKNLQDCVEIGNFDVLEARRFDALIAPLALGARLSRRAVQEVERYIVYIPPTPERETLAQKLSLLRQLGVEDFYVINDSSDLRRGISLGMFKSADAAQQHLVKLTRQGVQDARVVPRVGAVGKTAFQMRSLDAAAREALEKIRIVFSKQEMRACMPGIAQ